MANEKPSEPTMVVKKRIPVYARLVVDSEVVLTAHGRVRAEPGDYVLRDPATGDTWPIKPDIYAATYESAQQGAMVYGDAFNMIGLLRSVIACGEKLNAADDAEIVRVLDTLRIYRDGLRGGE